MLFPETDPPIAASPDWRLRPIRASRGGIGVAITNAGTEVR
jgi:hypothetical protein